MRKWRDPVRVEAAMRGLLWRVVESLREVIREGVGIEDWRVRFGGLLDWVWVRAWIWTVEVVESESKAAVAIKRWKGERGGIQRTKST